MKNTSESGEVGLRTAFKWLTVYILNCAMLQNLTDCAFKLFKVPPQA